MASLLTQTIRSRWLAIAVHLGLWLILILTLINLRSDLPNYRENTAFSTPTESLVPADRVAAIFSSPAKPVPIAWSNAANPFFTQYFIPPPKPAPPPPPTTRKVQLTYQGFFLGGEEMKHAIVRVATNFHFVQIGAQIDTNLTVVEATAQLLTLTNRAAQTNLLPLNVQTEIEVPL